MADSTEEINQILNDKTQSPGTIEAGNRDATAQKQSRPSSANRELQKEREERIKQMKERQNEERQKKLEELKAQALAAQKFREQKEEERRRRMDDLRRRENDRRSQVEERRRAIIEADNERREYILRKNQERDQRMETKRRSDRGSIQFAFGSSTPRMIDTSDSGMCSSFWAHRRATSITNVAYTGAALTRRSSERELTDGAAKKRATSASGLDRSTDDQRRMSSSMYEVFNWTSTSECPRKLTFSLAGTGINIDDPPTAGDYQPAMSRSYASGKDDTAEMNYQRTVNRRKTDLMPTIPSPRDSSRSSLGTHTPRTPGLRSGEMTPTSLNTSRPGSAMSSSTTASGVVYRRSLPAQRKPRPASIAVTGVSASGLKEEKPPLPKTGPSGASVGLTSASSKHRLSSAGSGSIHTTPAKSSSGTETPTKKASAPQSADRQRVANSRGTTPKASSTPLQSPGPEKASRNLHDSLKKMSIAPAVVDVASKKVSAEDKPTPKQAAPKEAEVVAVVQEKKPDVPKMEVSIAEEEKPVQQEAMAPQQVTAPTVEQTLEQHEQPTAQKKHEEEMVPPVQQAVVSIVAEAQESAEPKPASVEVVEEPTVAKQPEQPDTQLDTAPETSVAPVAEVHEANNTSLTVDVAALGGDSMTASMIAKRINTEEEAKAALAERRRLAREEAERLAELERKRIEAEEQAERQRIAEEEERLRKLEEETIRLAEEQRRMEEERLQQAIEEARRRDEEERKRREEEARQKVEREEAERKAREEAERQRVEMAERLKKEEKEREERRKRVEAIMSRTRAKGTANNTPTKNNEDDKENAMSKSQIVLSSTPAATLPTGTAMSASTISMTDSFIASEIRQEQQQQEQSLEKAMESLSLSNNNINNTNSSSSNSSSSSETLANSSSLNNNNNGSIEFDRSVTDKENLLLRAGAPALVNNNLNNGGASNGTVGSSPAAPVDGVVGGTESTNGSVNVATTNGKADQQQQQQQPPSSNGSSTTTANSTSDLIIEDALMGQTNGHKNGTIDNVFDEHAPHKLQSSIPSDATAVAAPGVPLDLNDFLIPPKSTQPNNHLNGGDGDSFSPYNDAAIVGEQQQSSFDSSATSSTTTTDTTTVTIGGDTMTVAANDQLIDFASFSTSDEAGQSLPLTDHTNLFADGSSSDANFNPLTPFGTGATMHQQQQQQQQQQQHYHNLSNNNSINLFDATEPTEHAHLTARYDGSNGDATGGNGSSAAIFDLALDSDTTTTTTTTSSTHPTATNSHFFNNNNTTPNNPWLVSAASDGQENRDLSLL